MITGTQRIHKKILSDDIDSLEEEDSKIQLRELHSYIEGLKAKKSSSRTAKLWLMFMELVSVVSLLI